MKRVSKTIYLSSRDRIYKSARLFQNRTFVTDRPISLLLTRLHVQMRTGSVLPFPSLAALHNPGVTYYYPAPTDSGPQNTRRMANDRTSTRTPTHILPQWPPLPMQRFILSQSILHPLTCPGWP